MDSDDDSLTLSSHALSALAEFRREEKEKVEQLEKLYKEADENFKSTKKKISIDAFQEDWQLSQFWYSDETAAKLGRALLEGADEDTVIVVASAPSVYAAIKNFSESTIPTKHIYLLEYDKRFEILAGSSHFRFYDYTKPKDIPNELRHKCHRLLIDPPFLEETCQRNSAIAARELLTIEKTSVTAKGDRKYKLISSTGERMKNLIEKEYPETRMTDFIPEHKNGLSNEFRCYASFECSEWKFSK
ncbi:uncharacterized protein PRCAT00004836001 [Priceomyces carsonii]|uniref:uncharacterized protein n=1 Tax=Priceomyces carsonii TaxID=28549 RepID=UPI002EDB32F3|nr:unnamed protein product [Priceomyces carsonii]